MLAQAPEGGSADRRTGEDGVPTEGSLPNGVPTAAQISGLVGGGHGLENPNVHDPAPAFGDRPLGAVSQTTRASAHPEQVDPNYGIQDLGGNAMNHKVMVVGTTPRPPQPARRERMTPTSSMRLQEFFSAESTHEGQEQSGELQCIEELLAWIEYGINSDFRVFPSLKRSVNYKYELRLRDFPAHQPLPPPVPLSWSTTRQEPPLFDARQLEQMRRAQMEHPWIYGNVGQQSEPESDHSSRLQAEVQRQLEEYTARYHQQVQSLMREVDQLRDERSYWMGRASRGVEGQDHSVPGGGLPNLPPVAPLPPGVRQYLKGIHSSQPGKVLLNFGVNFLYHKEIQAEYFKVPMHFKVPQEWVVNGTVLPPVNPLTSSVDIMDWLEMITTTMQDLSDGSAEWWNRVKKAATDAYVVWANSSPVEKLVIQPPREEELEEMVQRRSTGSTCALIFRLLTLYQPGCDIPEGMGEVATQMPRVESGSTRPDVEVSFRTSLVRSTLLVDTTPSYDSVEKYYHHLLAECEAMAVSTSTMRNLKEKMAIEQQRFSEPWYAKGGTAVEAIPPREASSSLPSAPPVDLQEVLADVGKMLKSMSATSLKKISVMEMGFKEKLDAVGAQLKTSVVKEEASMSGLLESGASHAMRVATEEEYQKGQPVSVTLAGEDVRVLRQNLQGTVLVRDEEGQVVQPIVPLGPVIEELGCTLKWKKGSLQLFHPKWGMMRVKLVNNCPEIQAREAHELIRELEAKHLLLLLLNNQVENLTARLEVMKKEEKKSWLDLLREYASSGNQSILLKVILTCPFTKDLPEDVKAMLVEGFDVGHGERYLKDLPITRKKRRALMAHNQWVVNLRSGEDQGKNDPFEAVPKGGKIVLNIDFMNSKLWDMNRKGGVYRLLLWAASQGLEPNLIPPLQQLETGDVARTFVLWMLAMVKGPGEVGLLMEFPSDEQVIREQDTPRASLWETELRNSFRSITSMKRASFYMGAYGHRALRPTTMATNYPEMIQLDGVYEFGNNCVPPSLLFEGEMKMWPSAFKQAVVNAILNYHKCEVQMEEELLKAGVRIGKLTKEQREAWYVHLLNDHQPYRADCSVCINAQATGYKHMRRKHPSLYSMALELAGPFKQSGRDMDHEDYKYILVAAYRCPKSYLSEKAAKELDAELYVPDEPEDLLDDAMEEEEDHKGHSDPEAPPSGGEDVEPMGPETLDDAVEQLEKAEETVTLYITRPLRRRTSAHVLSATKEIFLQLKQCGLHVAQVHSDRAREFKAKIFKEWVVDNELRQTKTAGGDPTGNSTAKLGIKWAKSRVRALLKGCGAPAKEWPMAVAHASSALWSAAFPGSPWAARPAAPFGSEVWFRSKMFQGKAEKRHDVTGSRWKRGWYRGPAQDVARGHLIVREDGGLTVAKSVKFNVVDPAKEFKDLITPAVAEGLPEELLSGKTPRTRKEIHDEIEFRARMLKEGKDYSLNKVVELYRLLECLGDVGRKVSKKASVTSWYTGAYVHGGVAGLRSNMTEYPYTTQYLVEVAKHHCGEIQFSAIGIAKNTLLGLRGDVHKYPASKNHVLPLGDCVGGSLWVQDECPGGEGREERVLPNGKSISGRVIEMKKGEVVSFSPKLWREVQPWEGERLVLLMYTPRATKLGEEKAEELLKTGFNVDMSSLIQEDVDTLEEEELGAIDMKMLQATSLDPTPQVFEEIDERDWIKENEVDQGTVLEERVEVSLKKMIKKAEVQYTQNAEDILKECEAQGKQLEVTHTISLNDVKKNLSKWKESALKEFHNLTETKKALSYHLNVGLRKTSFVACGNHISEQNAGFDLFAAGLDATSLRTMLAFNAKRKWSLGTTDIRQAFVLAKWKGQPVALEPPGIAYELGIAQPGDMWFVEQAIYGLRESPALWSQHRDEELKIWKVVHENLPSEPLGYLLVYIDDLLIQAPDNIMQCDALDVLDYNHPIRFVGLELHRVPGGVELAQEGFIAELLRAYKHDGTKFKEEEAIVKGEIPQLPE
ncbi:RE1 [Symbiodinium sp. CCMP2592]|nr:RE1 [Symbiodinium sp. CCMP2592]